MHRSQHQPGCIIEKCHEPKERNYRPGPRLNSSISGHGSAGERLIQSPIGPVAHLQPNPMRHQAVGQVDIIIIPGLRFAWYSIAKSGVDLIEQRQVLAEAPIILAEQSDHLGQEAGKKPRDMRSHNHIRQFEERMLR
jgi:hypothetical protein